MGSLKRTERFGLMLSAEEREGLRELSEAEGLSEADVLRRLLRAALRNVVAETASRPSPIRRMGMSASGVALGR